MLGFRAELAAPAGLLAGMEPTGRRGVVEAVCPVSQRLEVGTELEVFQMQLNDLRFHSMVGSVGLSHGGTD